MVVQRGKSRVWIVFFLMLAFMAGLGIVVPLVYNLSLQLKTEDAAAAKKLWQTKGPADYDLEYRTKVDKDEPIEYRVAVRNGQVAFVATPKGDIVVMSEEAQEAFGLAAGSAAAICPPRTASSEELTRQHTIDGFFRLIEAKLSDDVAVGGRNYATATFDPECGYPIRYIHRVRGSDERIELNAHLLPAYTPYDPR
jgi:hypothetical protein